MDWKKTGFAQNAQLPARQYVLRATYQLKRPTTIAVVKSHSQSKLRSCIKFSCRVTMT
jgi:hypothetical protein